MASLAAGIVFGAGGKILETIAPSWVDAAVPLWLFAAVVSTVGLVVFFAARNLTRRRPQAFILITTFVQTRWLAGLLDNLVRSLDLHDVDVVVKLTQGDYSGRSQVQQLARMRKTRRAYLGGLIVAEQPELLQDELTAFCKSTSLPVVFLDRRPFPALNTYPPRTAFVGCDPAEIGEKAAQWVTGELLERDRVNPVVFVIGGYGQQDRHIRFKACLQERFPSSKISVNVYGQFSREHAKDIVDRYLRRINSKRDRLDAIFCTNDEMALGAADAVQEHTAAGNHYDGLLIVGVDGIDEAIATIKSGVTPFQATIIQDTQLIADTAVDLLLRLRAGEQVTTQNLVPTAIYPTQ